MNRLHHLAAAQLLALTLILSSGCETTKAVEVVPAPPQRTHYTLRAQEKTSYSAPLPTRTDYAVDWHYSDGHVESFTAFHTWDVLGTGRPSMVEVLADDGRTLQVLYDFDADGRTDVVTDAAGISQNH